MIVTEVYCFLQIEGIHCWPECPHEEVAYLRTPHRHMFHIKATISTTHDDRDVEFIILRKKIEEYLIKNFRPENSDLKLCYFGSLSCEMLARELVEQFDLIRCEVSEDGENGAIVTNEPISSAEHLPI